MTNPDLDSVWVCVYNEPGWLDPAIYMTPAVATDHWTIYAFTVSGKYISHSRLTVLDDVYIAFANTSLRT